MAAIQEPATVLSHGGSSGAEISARAAAGEQKALIDACSSLRSSIDRAVRDRRLEVRRP